MPRLRSLVQTTVLAALTGTSGIVYAASRSRPGTGGAAAPTPPPGLPPGRVVDVPGRGEMFVREAPGPHSDSPVVVLLHGWMFAADLNWFTCYGPVSEVARVIAVDHRGHGRGLRASEPFRLADVADDVAALLRHLGTGPVVAVGYSMGGAVAQLLWQRSPDVVHGLVLCATAASWADSPRNRLVWRGMGLLQVVLRVLPRFWWERLVHAQVSGRLPFAVTRMINSETPPEVLELLPWLIGELDRGSAEDVAEAGRELSRYDARGWLPSVDVPTAVVVTTRDQLVPPSDQRALAARIPGAQCYEVALDHDAAVADTGLFTATLRKALDHVLDARP